jgi:membrane protease YdiL (CAAX protease family)
MAFFSVWTLGAAVAQFDQPAAAVPAGADCGQAPADATAPYPTAPGPGPAGPAGAQGEAQAEVPASAGGRISFRRALGELGAVYSASFGLGIVTAIVLLRDPDFDSSGNIINSLSTALLEIFNYVMQAAVVIFGVGYFSLRRGLTLSSLFGHLKRTPAYSTNPYNAPGPYNAGNPYGAPQPAGQAVAAWGSGSAAGYQGYPAPGYGAQIGYGPQAYGVRPPAERGPGWQFARSYFLAMGGFIAFLIVALVYADVSNQTTGAPSQGNSLWLLPVGVFVSAAAGFGEEMLITGMVVTVLEQAGFGKRVWAIYLIAICLRIPFHLYYGWAAVGVICFTVVNVWVYRRWRLLWPIVLAHATYDFVESAGQTMSDNAAALLILALAFTTLVMVIIIACIEGSDAGVRRRYRAFAQSQGAVDDAPGQPWGSQYPGGRPLSEPEPPTWPVPGPGQPASQPVPQFLPPPMVQPGPQPLPGLVPESGLPVSAPAQFVQPAQPPAPPVLRIPDPAAQPPFQAPAPSPSPAAPHPPEAPEPPQFPAF